MIQKTTQTDMMILSPLSVLNKGGTKGESLLLVYLATIDAQRYWRFKEKNKRFDGWFHISKERIIEHLKMDGNMQARTFKSLVDAELIEYERAGFPPKRWVRISKEIRDQMRALYKKHILDA